MEYQKYQISKDKFNKNMSKTCIEKIIELLREMKGYLSKWSG